MDHISMIPLSTGMRNIAEGTSSILGHVIGSSTSKSRAASAKKLEFKLMSAIKWIDERPIRGEYKIWVLKNYIAPSTSYQRIAYLLSKRRSQNISSCGTTYPTASLLPQSTIQKFLAFLFSLTSKRSQTHWSQPSGYSNTGNAANELRVWINVYMCKNCVLSSWDPEPCQ